MDYLEINWKLLKQQKLKHYLDILDKEVLKEFGSVIVYTMRNQRFTLRLDEQTRTNLELLSKSCLRSQSDVIRLLINMEVEYLEKRGTESDHPKID